VDLVLVAKGVSGFSAYFSDAIKIGIDIIAAVLSLHVGNEALESESLDRGQLRLLRGSRTEALPISSTAHPIHKTTPSGGDGGREG
jgi:butyrate kinase